MDNQGAPTWAPSASLDHQQLDQQAKRTSYFCFPPRQISHVRMGSPNSFCSVFKYLLKKQQAWFRLFAAVDLGVGTCYKLGAAGGSRSKIEELILLSTDTRGDRCQKMRTRSLESREVTSFRKTYEEHVDFWSHARHKGRRNCTVQTTKAARQGLDKRTLCWDPVSWSV